MSFARKRGKKWSRKKSREISPSPDSNSGNLEQVFFIYNSNLTTRDSANKKRISFKNTFIYKITSKRKEIKHNFLRLRQKRSH